MGEAEIIPITAGRDRRRRETSGAPLRTDTQQETPEPGLLAAGPDPGGTNSGSAMSGVIGGGRMYPVDDEMPATDVARQEDAAMTGDLTEVGRPVGQTGDRAHISSAPDTAGGGALKTLETAAGVVGGVLDEVLGKNWEQKAADMLAFVRRRMTGEYEVDEFGYDPELKNQVLMNLVRPLYTKYFRVEIRGVENIPDTGPALIVANHSGTVPIDGLMLQVGVEDNHPAGRDLRMLVADYAFRLPFVGELARKSGHTLACTADAERLLAQGELVGVFPEGYKGVGKPFSERYKLQRFGRGGFVAAALRTRAPIIPCAIVGAEEIYPMIGNAKLLARMVGAPYVPVTPLFPLLGPLGMIPLPTKWTIQLGEPVWTDAFESEAVDDPMQVFNLTDQVRETIQHMLYRLLMQRRSIFF